jgi:hypothetical protein
MTTQLFVQFLTHNNLVFSPNQKKEEPKAKQLHCPTQDIKKPKVLPPTQS